MVDLSVRWDDNIENYLTDIGCEGVYWIHLAEGMVQWRDLVNMAVKYRS